MTAEPWGFRMAKSILVIEDDRDIWTLLEYNLSRGGYLVGMADRLDGCVERVERESPDLIILDVMLPDGDGFDFCRQLRANPVTKRIPILFLTARSQEVDRVFAANLEDAHMPEVEEAGGLSDAAVLVEGRVVPDRHLPAGKGDHLASIGLVPIIEWCAQERWVFWILPAKLGQFRTRPQRVQSLAADKVKHRQLETLVVTGLVQVDPGGPCRVTRIAANRAIVGQIVLGAQGCPRRRAGGRRPGSGSI